MLQSRKYELLKANRVRLAFLSAYYGNLRYIVRTVRSLCRLHSINFLFAEKAKELASHTFLGTLVLYPRILEEVLGDLVEPNQ